MELEVGFGNGVQRFTVPERNLQGVLTPNPVPHALTGEREVRRALSPPLALLCCGRSSTPARRSPLLPAISPGPCPPIPSCLPCWTSCMPAGPGRRISPWFSHWAATAPRPREEMRHLAGEQAWAQIRCVDSDPADVVHLGVTSAGTPVDITRVVAEADRRICLGNIEYHYFAGIFRAGAKAIMPGVSTPSAIQSNHSMMVRESACAGNLEGNPLRRDIEEAAAMCGVDYILNVVLDEHKQIVCAVAGDVTLAHREGLPLSGQALPQGHRPPCGYRHRVPGRRAQGPEPLPDPEGFGQRQACRRQGRRGDPGGLLPGGSGRHDLPGVDDHHALSREHGGAHRPGLSAGRPQGPPPLAMSCRMRRSAWSAKWSPISSGPFSSPPIPMCRALWTTPSKSWAPTPPCW